VDWKRLRTTEKMAKTSCPVCCNVFLPTSEVCDRRPMVVCGNGDSICADCCTEWQEKEKPDGSKCPTCGDDLLMTRTVNEALLEMIQTYASALDDLPEISANEMQLEKKPFAEGGFGRVYNAIWHNQRMVIKVIVPRDSQDIDKQTKKATYEANLTIGFHHPNVIRLFGTTKVNTIHLGIVMEKAEHGSLDKWIGKMDHEKAANIALGIIDGLAFVHSKHVIHRDIKPQNILMFGPKDDMIPKIADFGLSKVSQSVVTMTGGIGTYMLYMAPEVLSRSMYGCSADVFSLAMMLFEVFSGQPPPAKNPSQPVIKTMSEIMRGTSRSIPESFPVPICLHGVIERGWATNPNERPSLHEYKSAMKTLIKEPASLVRQLVQRNVTTKQQVDEMANVNIAIPVLGMSWDTSCEVLNSKELRLNMIIDIEKHSEISSMINNSVLSAMKVIPRHIFIEANRLDHEPETNQPELVNKAYMYNNPVPATTNSNESSPETIVKQLSMTGIIQGQSVLLIGINGGYIQSLIAQLVGINGSVVTVTADEASMNVCRDRVDRYCPWKSNISWIKVSDIQNRNDIVAELKRQKKLFHTVIYCGAVADFPSEMKELLHLHDGGNVSIMAPVKEDEGVRFQLYLRRRKDAELRTVTDFGVTSDDAL